MKALKYCCYLFFSLLIFACKNDDEPTTIANFGLYPTVLPPMGTGDGQNLANNSYIVPLKVDPNSWSSFGGRVNLLEYNYRSNEINEIIGPNSDTLSIRNMYILPDGKFIAVAHDLLKARKNEPSQKLVLLDRKLAVLKQQILPKNMQVGSSIAVLNDSTFVTSAFSHSCYDFNLNLRWNKTLASEGPVNTLSANNSIFVESFNNTGNKYFLRKFDAEGKSLAALYTSKENYKQNDFRGNPPSHFMSKFADGFAIIGEYYRADQSTSLFIEYFDWDLKLKSSKLYPYSNFAEPGESVSFESQIQLVEVGDGFYTSFITKKNDGTNGKVVLVKFKKNWDLAWSKVLTISKTEPSFLTKFAKISSFESTLLITGNSEYNGIPAQFFIRTDLDGNILQK